MANAQEFLTSPSPLSLGSGANSFVSNWMDKRSGSVFGMSIVFYGATPPDGYATIETSNAPPQPGSLFGQPNNSGDDATTLANSQTTITLNPLTGLYSVNWQISCIGAHYVRVRYTANTNKTGLSANVYGNVVYTS